jgi:hypothetical protein
MGKAALNVPVTQIIKAGATWTPVKVVTFPLGSQLAKA